MEKMARRPLSLFDDGTDSKTNTPYVCARLCACWRACLCVSSKTENEGEMEKERERETERERERERKCRQMSAFTLWEAQGCLPRTERQEREKRKRKTERDREGRIK